MCVTSINSNPASATTRATFSEINLAGPVTTVLRYRKLQRIKSIFFASPRERIARSSLLRKRIGNPNFSPNRHFPSERDCASVRQIEEWNFNLMRNPQLSAPAPALVQNADIGNLGSVAGPGTPAHLSKWTRPPEYVMNLPVSNKSALPSRFSLSVMEIVSLKIRDWSIRRYSSHAPLYLVSKGALSLVSKGIGFSRRGSWFCNSLSYSSREKTGLVESKLYRCVMELLTFASKDEFEAWMEEHHATTDGVWIKVAKKGTGVPSVHPPEALDIALCFGWIDGLRRSIDETYYQQKYTPRRARSKWSKINVGKVQELIAAGKMRPSGMAEIERAKGDGRWDAAYDPSSTITVPLDLQAELDARPQAAAFFATLKSMNRYAILYRLQDAKKPETRARRLAHFVEMLERGETLH